MWQKADRISLLVFLVVITGIFGWGAWELHVRNENQFLSPEQKVHAREMAFHEQIGNVDGRVDYVSEELGDLKKEFPNYMKQVGEVNGRVDTMQAYFDKYSPEVFEELMREVKEKQRSFELNNSKEQVLADIWVEADKKYVPLFKLTAIAHLPNEFQWKQHMEKVAQMDTANKTQAGLITTLQARIVELEKRLGATQTAPEIVPPAANPIPPTPMPTP